MKTLPITIAITAVGIGVYYIAGEAPTMAIPSDSVSLIVEDLDQNRFYAETIEQIQTASDRVKFPPVADRSLSDWLAESTSIASTRGKAATRALLDQLSRDHPQISSATACVAFAGSVASLSSAIAAWASEVDPSFNFFATHVFADSNSEKIGCTAVAIERLQRFSPESINSGERSFITACRHCGQSHIGSIDQNYGSAALICPHCSRAYELLVFKPDRKICRANELLTGWTPPVRVPRMQSKQDEMFFIWKAVLDRVRYAKDLEGLRGNLDTWQLASDTWKHKNGDCEDSSVLLTDWLIERGFDARVVVGMTAGRVGHAWCVVALDGAFYILETTDAKPDIQNPPYASQLRRHYTPRYQFNREAVYFRKDDEPNPRYWSTNSWIRLEAPKAFEAAEAAALQSAL